MLYIWRLTNMEKEQSRLLTKSICVDFALDQVLRAQQLLERFRLCDCPDVGGFECRCVSEEEMEAIRNKSYMERSTQTVESNGESDTEKILTKASEVCRIFTVQLARIMHPCSNAMMHVDMVIQSYRDRTTRCLIIM